MESPAQTSKASSFLSYLLLVVAAVIAGLAGGMWYRSRARPVQSVVKQHPPEDAPNPFEYAIKANHMYHFLSAIHWPALPVRDEFVVGILGDDPFGEQLSNRLKDAQVEGVPVRIVKLKSVSEIKCQMLFVAAKGAPPLADIIKACAGKPIATVGEAKDFLKAGGMIQFDVEDGHVKFRASEDVAQREGLEFDSALKRKSN